MNVLTHYNGHQPKSKCWYFAKRNQYYLVGDIYKKGSGGAYKFPDGKHSTKRAVVWSNILKQYLRKKESVKVLLDKNGNTDYLHKDSPALIDCYPVWDGKAKKFLAVVPEVNPKTFKFSSNYGVYYVNCNLEELSAFHHYKEKKAVYTFPNVYNYRDMPASEKHKAAIASKVPKSSFKFDEELAKGLGTHSFGTESETSANYLREKIVRNFGFIPLKDGSITGNEFVSCPLEGVNGLRNAYGFFRHLERFAKVAYNCSFHVHIGNVKTQNKAKFTAALYTLYYELQNRMYELVPGHKTDIQVLKKQDKGNGKDYCKPLKGLGMRGLPYEERYNRILQWANDWQPFNGAFYKDEQQKWFKNCRYYQLNLYNWLNNNGTIEFRLHHGILEPMEKIFWVCICNSIINYALQNADDILTVNKKYEIEDMINFTYTGKLAQSMCSFIQKRRNSMNDLIMVGDNGVNTVYQNQGYKKYSSGGKNKMNFADYVKAHIHNEYNFVPG